MAKLKFTMKGTDFEYEGEPQEVQAFFQRLMNDQQITIGKIASTMKGKQAATPMHDKPTKRGSIDFSLKPDNEIKGYILGKPSYAHTLFEVQERFYGNRFKSRGETERMYHKTSKHLKKIRKKIETEQKGKFQEVLGEDGTKRFTFERSQQATLVA